MPAEKGTKQTTSKQMVLKILRNKPHRAQNYRLSNARSLTLSYDTQPINPTDHATPPLPPNQTDEQQKPTNKKHQACQTPIITPCQNSWITTLAKTCSAGGPKNRTKNAVESRVATVGLPSTNNREDQPNSRTKSISAQVCAQAKSQKGFKGTSLHNMNDQRPHSSAAKSWSRFRSTPPVRSIAMLQRQLHPWQVEWRTYAACRGKDLSCGTTRSTGCT